MFGQITSRFYENINSNKITLNLLQDDMKDYNKNDEYDDILTKRGKIKNKSKIEYFKNYINSLKEIKFKTARPIEIFRKKEEKKQKEIKKDLNIINENILDNNKFNLIKETFQEGKQEQMVKINYNNDIINKRNEISNKIKKNRQEISSKIIKNNEDILNKLKKNKKMTKIIEKEKEKMQKKIKKLKDNEKAKNLSTEKALDLLNKDNEKFLKLVKTKKMQLIIKNKINKSFNNSYKKEKIKIISSITKTNSNENDKRKIKNIRNKLHMKIIDLNIKYNNNIIEKDIFNKKCKNKIKSSNYYSKSCSNKNDISENYNKEITKKRKNLKQGFKNQTNNQLLEIENKDNY